MAAITTAQVSSIHKKIIEQYPQFAFVASELSHWSPQEKTIYHPRPRTVRDLLTLFHELGHALKGHSDFEQDIDLLKMEREAWDVAIDTAAVYGVSIEEAVIEEALDGYRDWLHARSRCPTCQNPGVQQKATGAYTCLLCHTHWRANDARQCGLKRYTTKNTRSQ